MPLWAFQLDEYTLDLPVNSFWSIGEKLMDRELKIRAEKIQQEIVQLRDSL